MAQHVDRVTIHTKQPELLRQGGAVSKLPPNELHDTYLYARHAHTTLILLLQIHIVPGRLKWTQYGTPWFWSNPIVFFVKSHRPLGR